MTIRYQAPDGAIHTFAQGVTLTDAAVHLRRAGLRINNRRLPETVGKNSVLIFVERLH